ncbi:MAG: MGMT family protein [Bacteroidota bacterium]|nr:MGMT family protein [Bacteroidota bacterium]MDP4205315.1 MGMT family protein [Bacteroidota bacterium]
MRKGSDKTDFFEQVFSVVCLIPFGRITTYGAIARYLGSPQSSRLVGWAMNVSHTYKEFVPAHRVVNRNGLLSGKHHFDTPITMQQLLENEGIEVEDDRIINFRKHFWDPGVELDRDF